MKSIVRVVVFLAASTSWSGLGHPAEITSQIIEDGGSALTLIFVEGELVDGDERDFRNVAVQADDAVVLLSSPGGSLHVGIEIGNAIRLKGFRTLVPKEFHCASACALAWLAGAPRMMGDNSAVGFHAAFRIDASDVPSGPANAVTGAYLNQLGLPTSAVIYITEALPSEIRWLTFDDAKQIGVEVVRFDPETDEGPSRTNNARVGSSAGTGSPGIQAPAPYPQVSMAGGVWIQVASRSSQAEAISVATTIARMSSADASVYLYTNGWYGVVLGPYPTELAYALRARLLEARSIPSDSLMTRGDKFARLVWGSPRSPDVNVSELEARALRATQAYFESSSLSGDSALDFVRQAYAMQVLYYGKWTSKSDVLDDKLKFVTRWPERKYVLREDSVSLSCEATGGCSVEGTVDWLAYSQLLNQTSIGSASFHLIFSSFDPITIVADESSVLSRKIVSGSPSEDAASSRSETFAVGDIATNDALNMRAQPGTSSVIVTSMPPGSRGVVVSACQWVPGYGIKWCQVRWKGYQGWASACCLLGEQTGRRPE
jgi:hypothetical protein